MTTSGTWNFSLDVADVCGEAWERCGKNPDDLTGHILRSARRSLMLMMIDWANQGVNLWTVDTQTVTLTPTQNFITAVTATADLLECNLINYGLEQPMNFIGRSDWMALSNKAQSGPPTQIWVEKILPAPVLHVFPTPDQAYQIRYTRFRVPMDLSASSQAIESPMLWLDALCAGLAYRLAQKFVPQRMADLQASAAVAYANAATENRERVPFIVRPSLG